jgi:hypothetical protein
MRYLKTFESHSTKDILIIVDVQKSFSKFFTKKYVDELKKYCNKFNKVYQIWDNHVDGKNVDKDYLYDENPEEVDNHEDLYEFPNQVDLIEKRYNYDVTVDFYKPILDENEYLEIKKKEDNGELVRGDFFHTNEDTIIIYIGNNHNWHHLPKKLYDLFMEITEAQIEDRVSVTIVGGADSECLEDIEVAAKALGVNFKNNDRYIYSATNCPIK